MKKNRLVLHRETLRKLDLARVRGGVEGEEFDDTTTDPGGGGSIWTGPYVCYYPSVGCVSGVVTICPTCN